jgi:hypothetical protein
VEGGTIADEIRAVMSRLGAVEPADLMCDELAEGCLAWAGLVNVVLVQSSRMLAEFELRQTWVDDGATSAAAWVASRTGDHRAELASRVRVGQSLTGLPAVSTAARNGDIGFDHARRIVECARKRAVFTAEDETFLLEQARVFDAATFRMLAKEWRAKAEDASDDDGPIDAPARREFLHYSQTFDGWYRLDGELGPDNGAVVAAYFEEFVDKALRAQRDGDPALEKLPVSGLRAEGLVDLVAQHQRRDPGKESVSDRYRVAVVVRPDECPMAVCDSDLYRVVISADGEVLDIGRTSREWTMAIRRAVTLRDGGCVFPGCDRPPSWCDVHHCWDWDHGGPTCQDNGALLCRRHHTFIHAKKWRVVIPTARGKPEVLKPDGTPFTLATSRRTGQRRLSLGPPILPSRRGRRQLAVHWSGGGVRSAGCRSRS